ncbi:hypothetical protein DdX_10574 [Ditylenchus destructor]|uniref:Uncharacterized protein n=1 Tax=Ditylenchus destructor TaxID=166010 RepID=A0AAD4N3N6_9BILA|nr:hypothetical protein DdX_10574 [Ditylenchus destructor]
MKRCTETFSHLLKKDLINCLSYEDLQMECLVTETLVRCTRAMLENHCDEKAIQVYATAVKLSTRIHLTLYDSVDIFGPYSKDCQALISVSDYSTLIWLISAASLILLFIAALVATLLYLAKKKTGPV